MEGKDKILVFVYGTLKQGFGNHKLLGASPFLGKDKILGNMYDLGGFPGLKKQLQDSAESIVEGEVYEVDDDTLARLDRLEGHPRFYTREPIDTLEGKYKCWVYYYNHEVHKRHHIISGVW